MPVALVALAALAGAVAGCGGGPDASVGVGREGDTVVVHAKACGDGAIERIDVVDPLAPDTAVWSATASPSGRGSGSGSGSGLDAGPGGGTGSGGSDPEERADVAPQAVPIEAEVDGFSVEDHRPDGALPDRRLRVLVEGPDGESWGGPRFTPSELEEGVLRVAAQDVPLAEWQAEPARCPDVGVAAALVGGAATAVVAALLWLVVRLAARPLRRRS